MVKSRRLRWTGHVARMKEGRCAFQILTGKRALGRPTRIWDENIRMILKEMGINTRNWVDLSPDRDYWIVLVKRQGTSGSLKAWT